MSLDCRMIGDRTRERIPIPIDERAEIEYTDMASACDQVVRRLDRETAMGKIGVSESADVGAPPEPASMAGDGWVAPGVR